MRHGLGGVRDGVKDRFAGLGVWRGGEPGEKRQGARDLQGWLFYLVFTRNKKKIFQDSMINTAWNVFYAVTTYKLNRTTNRPLELASGLS